MLQRNVTFRDFTLKGKIFPIPLPVHTLRGGTLKMDSSSYSDFRTKDSLVLLLKVYSVMHISLKEFA